MYSYPNKNLKPIFLTAFFVVVCLFALNINKVFSATVATNWLTGNPISDRQIDLNWGSYFGIAKSFTVMVTNKATPTASDWVTVATLPATTISYSHKDGLGPNTTYKYKVMADGVSSNIASVTTKPATVGWAGRAGHTFDRPGKLNTAYYMEWDYTKGASGWNSVGSNVQGIHSVSGSDSTCPFSTSYTTVCTNGTCTLKPVLNSGSTSCVPSTKLKTVTAPFNNGDYGDPDDPPEANITSWIAKSPTCVGPKCTITKVCSNDGKGIATRRSDTQIDYVNSAGESSKIIRVDDDVVACPSYAPVCGMVGTTPTCQCDNNGGKGPGFYADQKPAIKDILDINVNYDPTYLNSLTVKPVLPVSAFDNFYVEVNLKLCPKAGVAAPSVGFKVAIVTKDANNNDVIVAQGTLSKYTDSAKQVSYRWGLIGSGKTTGFVTESTPTFIQAQRLQLLLSNISKGKKPIIRITDVGTGQTKEQMLDMSACGFAEDLQSRITKYILDFTDQYKIDTLKNRKFTPSLPVTAYDDFYVEITLSKCRSTLSLPDTFDASLYTKTTGSGDILLTTGKFQKVSETNSEKVYRWYLYGWGKTNGIVTDVGTIDFQKINILGTNYMKGIMPTVKIIDPNTKQNASMDIIVSNCVHVYGEDKPNGIAIAVGAGEKDMARGIMFDMINYSEITRKAISEVDPFKKYINEFSFWAQTGSFPSSLKLTDFDGNTGTSVTINKCSELTDDESVGKRDVFITFEEKEGLGGVTQWGLITVYIPNNKVSLDRYISFGGYSSMLDMVIVHEIGHKLGRLYDEYVYGIRTAGDSDHQIRKLDKDDKYRNCALNPMIEYSKNGNKLYGDLNNKGCTDGEYYRPSNQSIMLGGGASIPRHLDTYKFNVISCGYLAAAIKGRGHGPDYWEECMTLDTVKPTGVTSFNWRKLLDSNTATLIDAFGRLFDRNTK